MDMCGGTRPLRDIEDAEKKRAESANPPEEKKEREQVKSTLHSYSNKVHADEMRRLNPACSMQSRDGVDCISKALYKSDPAAAHTLEKKIRDDMDEPRPVVPDDNTFNIDGRSGKKLPIGKRIWKAHEGIDLDNPTKDQHRLLADMLKSASNDDVPSWRSGVDVILAGCKDLDRDARFKYVANLLNITGRLYIIFVGWVKYHMCTEGITLNSLLQSGLKFLKNIHMPGSETLHTITNGLVIDDLPVDDLGNHRLFNNILTQAELWVLCSLCYLMAMANPTTRLEMVRRTCRNARVMENRGVGGYALEKSMIDSNTTPEERDLLLRQFYRGPGLVDNSFIKFRPFIKRVGGTFVALMYAFYSGRKMTLTAARRPAKDESHSIPARFYNIIDTEEKAYNLFVDYQVALREQYYNDIQREIDGDDNCINNILKDCLDKSDLYPSKERLKRSPHFKFWLEQMEKNKSSSYLSSLIK